MNSNYFELQKIHLKNIISCVLTSNIDERYSKIYPKITKLDILNLASHYPSSDYNEIKTKIKHHFNIKTNLVFGSGSEELIIRLNDIIELKNYKVAFVTPLFYRVRETFHGKKVCIKEENLFNCDYNNYDIVWLQNPNLFSGNSYEAVRIQKLLRKFPNVIFLIDEAGIFTLSNWKKYSMIDKCHRYNNLVVLSTFSKIYGLSGLRIGFATGRKKLLLELEEKNLTFPISSFAECYLFSVLDHEGLIKELKLKIIGHKNQLVNILKSNPEIIIKESLVNCIFFKHKNKKIYNYLLKSGLLCLNLDDHRESKDGGYVRMTVHSSEAIHRQVMVRLKKMILNI
ncbi:MAG: aminotransferase class I/II-fold pyridoxal phosphate-dependent enzyme [Candidatus Paceibacterota bacterium]